MSRSIHMLRSIALALVAMLAPAVTAAAQPEKTFNLSIAQGRVAAPERLLRVMQGDRVHVRAVSDQPGELHLHGYRVEAKLRPGAVADLTFEAYATGRYPFEWHGETGKGPKSHHGPPLAALEVLPR